MNDLISRLEASVAAGRARHAYLLAGVDIERADGIARGIASLLLLGNKDIARLSELPDYIELEGSISIAQFRDEIQPEIYRETYESRCRAVVFRSADRLSQMVQNAMLKVIEEPPTDTYFILTGNEYGILPTICSRCTIVRCPAARPVEIARELTAIDVSEADAEAYAKMSGCITKRALRLASDEGFRAMRRELYSAFIKALQGAPDFAFTKAKRDRADWMEACELLLLFTHDMLACACGQGVEFCPDYEAEIKKLSSHFTIGKISSIINKLTESCERASSNASGGAVFDRLFADTAMISLSK